MRDYERATNELRVELARLSGGMDTIRLELTRLAGVVDQVRDHETRIRRIERWMYAIPASVLLAAGSVVIALLARGH